MNTCVKAVIYFCIAALVLCAGSSVVCAKEKKEGQGKLAIVVRALDVDVNLHRQKAESTGFLIGGLIGLAVSKSSEGPAKKDLELVEELKGAMGPWSMAGDFKDKFLEGINPQHRESALIIVVPEGRSFEKVDREFYRHGSSRYDAEEAVYDYTPLASEGIDRVWDVRVVGVLVSGGGRAQKLIPIVAASMRHIDLDSKRVISDKKVVARFKGKEAVKEFSEFTANGGAHTKGCLTELAVTAAMKLAAKMK